MGFRARIRRFLERLGAAGEREFGGKAPSCCSGKAPADREGRPREVAKKADIR